MEGILTMPTLQKEILTVPTIPTVTAMPPVMSALQPASMPTNLGWVYCDVVVCINSYDIFTNLAPASEPAAVPTTLSWVGFQWYVL